MSERGFIISTIGSALVLLFTGLYHIQTKQCIPHEMMWVIPALFMLGLSTAADLLGELRVVPWK